MFEGVGFGGEGGCGGWVGGLCAFGSGHWRGLLLGGFVVKFVLNFVSEIKKV